jgi:hypothetical protein
MKFAIQQTLMLVAVLIASASASATSEHATDKPLDPKHVSAEIYKKCLAKGSSAVEQEVCKARRPAIEQCVEQETAAKDAKAAKTKCELLYIAPTKK